MYTTTAVSQWFLFPELWDLMYLDKGLKTGRFQCGFFHIPSLSLISDTVAIL
jgi:hypothetical protein